VAIIIEEEKRKINWFALTLIIFLIAIISAAIYYLFFAPTPFAEKIAPSNLQSLQDLSSVKLQPETVINNPYFQILKQYVNPIEVSTDSIGKTNPFVR
jgi:uncharacterized membrane protein